MSIYLQVHVLNSIIITLRSRHLNIRLYKILINHLVLCFQPWNWDDVWRTNPAHAQRALLDRVRHHTQQKGYGEKSVIMTISPKGPSQFVLKSIRTKVNSYSFWSIRTRNFGQFVLIWSIRTHVWSVRTHFG